ncbi:basic leucine zipper 61-like isoform X2 [Cajanus cajan]|uniref:basic leucine zipper 61-like isoform X2 n=1 Tax=Cajanus cajan TaxID=3821 RepID=UPI00098D9660|nr:basic leucine zipper 61-like isoform X2 [Cajanus cajan]
MGELRIRSDLVENELWPKKPTLIKPIPMRAQSNVSIGYGSSFQPWQKPSNPVNELVTIPENDNHLTEENASINDHNTANEAQPNIEHETKKKLKRIISNRHSARRSRLKKLAYMEDLENIVKSHKKKIEFLNEQIAEQEKEQLLLQIEHHTLKYHMAAREKHRILQEGTHYPSP